ncbi:ATP-binding protein [Streptomyces cucumeris]|uniref:ATP-binding protein n=1 Tax=Streptomyces cucumeris TaxID=2962890 RepID=UPI003D734919
MLRRSPPEHETPRPDRMDSGAAERRAMRFPPLDRSVRAARDFVVETLAQWGRTDHADNVRLCVSELVSNALLHGSSGGGHVLVHVELHATRLRLEVHDTGHGTPAERSPEETADNGRGLLLVSAFADRWGVEARQGPGKCVWATFHHIHLS